MVDRLRPMASAIRRSLSAQACLRRRISRIFRIGALSAGIGPPCIAKQRGPRAAIRSPTPRAPHPAKGGGPSRNVVTWAQKANKRSQGVARPSGDGRATPTWEHPSFPGHFRCSQVWLPLQFASKRRRIGQHHDQWARACAIALVEQRSRRADCGLDQFSSRTRPASTNQSPSLPGA